MVPDTTILPADSKVLTTKFANNCFEKGNNVGGWKPFHLHLSQYIKSAAINNVQTLLNETPRRSYAGNGVICKRPCNKICPVRRNEIFDCEGGLYFHLLVHRDHNEPTEA